jgi:RNA-directed DNA polymerase
VRNVSALKLDIAKCFDKIDHQALLAKAQAPPMIRRQLKAWLKAGILERSYWIPGSYAPVLSEKRNSFSGLLKNKGLKRRRERQKSGWTPSTNPRPWNPTRA